MQGSSEQAWETGRTAHPGLDLPCETFRAFAEERSTASGGTLDRAPDLYLACACARGVKGAAERFAELYGERVPLYISKITTSTDRIDEVRQVVLVRCLLALDGKAPAIASYSARGSLDGWVRATAVREALALERQGARHVTLGGSALEAGASPGDAALIAHYREPVARAFAAAATSLPREHRALLRLHYVHAITTAQLAQMFQISRATLVRRLTDAREQLVAALQQHLAAEAGVPRDDCEAVLRLVKSQIDLRLSVLLRETGM
jgi:RNA polymerase sigma-70 factor (ECF subfamily)